MKVDVGWGQLTAPNLIANPDITVDLSCDYGWVSFFEGCVNSWQSTNGTPHHVRWHFNQCFEEYTGAGRITNCLYSMCVSDNDETNVWNEAIYQTVNIIKNDFITYDLGISLNLLRCDNEDNPDLSFVNAPFGLRFANDLTISDNVWEPILGTDFEQIITQTISSFSPVTISMQDIEPDRNFSNIQLYVDLPHGNNNIGETQIEINNIELKCSTSALADIRYNSQTKRFEAVNADLTNAFTQYYWTLPDNTNSSSASPFFDFTESGSFNVCLDVLDSHGCLGQHCKTINIISTCNGFVEGYRVHSTLPSNETSLTALINHPTNPIPHTVLSNGTIQINDVHFELSTDLIIDVKTEFLRTNWYCNGGTMIDIRHDLVMKHSTFEACAEMWKGFKHKNNRRLNMNDCVIKDAEFGIEMTGRSKLWSLKDRFYDCYIGIYAPKEVNNSFIFWTQGTWFVNTNQMKPAYNGQSNWSNRTNAGIEVLQNSTLLNIRTNRFINLHHGIILSETRSDILKGTFLADESYLPRIGISMSSLSNSKVDISDFYEMNVGISETGNSSGTLKISYCNFYNETLLSIPGSGGGAGIQLTENQANDILIEYCTFISEAAFGSGHGRGIDADGVHFKLNIKNNTFFHRNEDFYTAIDIQGETNGTLIENNTISREEANNGVSTALVSLTNNNKLVMKNTSLNKVFASNDLTGAIRINNTSDSRFMQNTLNQSNLAILVLGESGNNLYCCNTSSVPSLRSISFNDNNICDLRNNLITGLRLGSMGNIGVQDLPGNLWQDNLGSNEGTRATMEGDDRSEQNQISFNPGQTNSSPDDVVPPNLENTWFRQSSIISNCSNNPECLDEFDPNGNGNGNNGGNETGNPQPPIGDPTRKLCDKVMANYFNFIQYAGNQGYPYPDQLTWNMNQYIQHYISLYGQSFFDSCIGDSVVWITPDHIEWFDAEKEKEDIFKLESSVEDNILQLSNESDSIYVEILAIVDSLGQSNDSTNLQNLYDEMSQIEYQRLELMDSVRTISRQKVIVLLNSIPNLPEQFGFLIKRKKVWEAELKTYLFGKDSTSQQEWDFIRSIANSCPIEFGKAVSEAQGLLSRYWGEKYEMNYESCQNVIPRSRENKYNIVENIVYPNPGSGLFYFNIPQEYNGGVISIETKDGVLLRTYNLTKEDTFSIDLNMYPDGVYFYKILGRNNQQKSGKIILIK